MSAPIEPSSPTRSRDESVQRVLVAVCTYNERENLPALVQAVREALPLADILVVDDNSPDGTGRWAEEAAASEPQLHCLVRTEDRGLGASLRDAMLWAIDRQYDWMLNLDADFSHSPEDLPRLLAAATVAADPLDCVVATRYAQGGGIEGWPLRRRLMSRAVNGFATTILRLPVSDCSGSMRCYRVSMLRQIGVSTLRSRGYAVFEEILVRLRRAGAKMGEVPIVFHERRSGQSKLTGVEAIKAAAQIVRLSLPGAGDPRGKDSL